MEAVVRRVQLDCDLGRLCQGQGGPRKEDYGELVIATDQHLVRILPKPVFIAMLPPVEKNNTKIKNV